MEQDRQHAVPFLLAEEVLLRARHALDHRIDGFEVRRVRRQHDGELVALA
jgi:hypothetical protein